MTQYATGIEPLAHDDPRAVNRPRANRIAHETLKAAGVKACIESPHYAVCEFHAAMVNEILKPIGRKALVSKTTGLRLV